MSGIVFSFTGRLALIRSIIGNGDPVLRLFDNLGNILATDDDSGELSNSLIVFNAAYTGNYVAGFRGFANSQYNYEFTATGLTTGVPEPATWAMMLIGFGAVGYSMRRRRKSGGIAQLA